MKFKMQSGTYTVKFELNDFRRDFEFEMPAYDAAARYVKMYLELKEFEEY